MSIASTKLAMGYVASTSTPDTCNVCLHSHPHQEESLAGLLHCLRGDFTVGGRGICDEFARDPDRRIQIGPTDI